MEPMLQWSLVVILATAAVTSGCPGDRPMKQLICRQKDTLHKDFDPCLCTHLVLNKELQDLNTGDVKKYVIDMKSVNPSLQVLGPVSSSSEAKGSELARTAHALELDGIFLYSTKDHTLPSNKENLISIVKVMATEFDSLRSSKRATDKYEDKKTIISETSGIIVQLPSEPQALGKHYDLKKLTKYVDYYVMSTENITDASEVGLAYHPSRLMGIDDVLNADSLIDLVSGLGAPHEKLIVSLPAGVSSFTLKDPQNNMPRAPVMGTPSMMSQTQLCEIMEEGGWTVERDEDLTAPYAYRNSSWVAFDDTTSAAIKGKYILLRDLAGAAVDSVELEDWQGRCNSSQAGVLKTLYDTFTNIARKPRAAQLLALQEQIHNAYNVPFSDVQLSPYRIVRVVDRAGSIQVVRKEAKTEFTCSRQGYFTHPSGCNRFYRCVKFNQYSSDFTVFEYDCPEGLAFDERYEVCVWPGSLSDASPCKGSSEIAPVPRSRYACPGTEGYYADPENCRWFFACLDHRRDGSALTAYEFRCPFGLVFDEKKLVCDWPWYVDGCGSGVGISSVSTGFAAADILEGRLRPAYASIPDVQVSGGRIENANGGYILGSALLSGSQEGPAGIGYSSAASGGHLVGVLRGQGADDTGAYVHDPTGDHGGDYIHQDVGGGQYVHQDIGGGDYVHHANPYAHSGHGSRVNVGDGSGAYVHDSRGDHGGDYVHQGGQDGVSHIGTTVGVTPSVISSTSYGQAVKPQGVLVQTNLGGAYGAVGSGSLHSGYGNGVNVDDGSGVYVHDTRGDHGGDYVHQAGPDGISHIGTTLTGGVTPSVISSTSYGQTGKPLGVIVQNNFGGGYKSDGVGTIHSGYGSGVSVDDRSGAYVHDTRGDHGGDYIHQPGPNGPDGVSYIGTTVTGGVTPSVVTSTGYSQAGKAQGVLVNANLHGGYGEDGYGTLHSGHVSEVNVGDGSGAYLHDSRGDHGGDYVHQAGRDGVSYIGTTVTGGVTPSVKSSTSYSQTGKPLGIIVQNNLGTGYAGSGISTHHSAAVNEGVYVHDARGDHGGDYVHSSIVGGSLGSGSTSVHGNNGIAVGYGTGNSAYIHDTTGDHGGEYVHTAGGSTSQGGKINHVSGGSGVHVHDSRGNYGGYIHNQGGLSKATIVDNGGAYVHDTRGNYGSGYVVNQDSTYFGARGHGYQDNSGAYVHDSTGDHGGDYIHHNIPAVPYIHDKNANRYYQGVGQTANYYANGYNRYVGQSTLRGYDIFLGGPRETYNAGITHDRTDKLRTKVHLVPQSYQTLGTQGGYYAGGYQRFVPITGVSHVPGGISASHVQNKNNFYGNRDEFFTSLSGIGGAAFLEERPISNGEFGYKTTSGISHGVTVTTPRPVTYQQSVGVSSIQYKQPVSPVVVSTTPVVPLSSVQYSVTPKPIESYHTVKPIQTYEVPHYEQPITVSTPAPPLISHSYKQPVKTFTVSGPSTIPVTTPSYKLTNIKISQPTPVLPVVSNTPIVPLNPVQYISTPAPTIVEPLIRTEYHHPVQPLEFVDNHPNVQSYQKHVVNQYYDNSKVAYPNPPVSYQKSPSVPIKPIVLSSPAPFRAQVSTVSVSSTPAVPLSPVQYVANPSPPLVSYSYKQPIISPPVHGNINYQDQKYVNTYEQYKPVINYSFKTQPVLKTEPVSPVIISSTPSVPLNPIQYSRPSVSYTSQPAVQYNYQSSKTLIEEHQPIRPLAISPQVTYHKTAQSYSGNNDAFEGYTYEKPAVKVNLYPSIKVSSTPSVPLNTVQYISTPAPAVVSYQQPIRPVSISTPAPAIVSYQTPKPQSYSTPIVTAVKYEQPIRPIVVSTPRPIVSHQEHLQHVTINTPTPAVVSYQRPVVVSTPAPPVVTYQETFKSAPPVLNYHQTYKPVIPAIIRNEPLKPLVVSTPAPVISYQKQIKPIVPSVVSYQQPIKPVVVSTPAPPVVSYQESFRPVAPAVYRYEETVKPIAPAVVNYHEQVEPLVVNTPAPAVVTYKESFKPVIVSTPAPTVVKYEQPLKPAVVPAVVHYQKPAGVYSTTSAPVDIKYSYKQPIVSTTYEENVKPVYHGVNTGYTYQQPALRTDYVKPIVNYSYQTPLVKTKYVQPITVTSTPVTPLSPVQYSPVRQYYEGKVDSYSSFNKKTAHYGLQYQPPVEYEKPLAPAVRVEYNKPALNTRYESNHNFVHTISDNRGSVNTYSYNQPAVQYGYAQPILREEVFKVKPVIPVTVSTTPAVPLNSVQYVTTTPAAFKYSFKTPVVPVQKVETEFSGYNYDRPAFGLEEFEGKRVEYVSRPVTRVQPIVTTTPVIPLNPVQYVSKQVDCVTCGTSKPVVVTTSSRPVTYSSVNLQEQSVDIQKLTPIVAKKPVVPIVTTSTPQVENVYTYSAPRVPIHETKFEYSFPKVTVPVTTEKTVYTVTQAPIVDHKPTAVFEEYFEANKNSYESRDQYEIKYRPAVPVEQHNYYSGSYETKIPVQYEFGSTIQTTQRPEIRYSITTPKIPVRNYVTDAPVNVVSQEFISDSYDQNINVNVDIPRIQEQTFVTTTTPTTVRINPTIKRVKVNEGTGQKYYVRKQKVRVRPVVTTTENYPAGFYSTTSRPNLQYSSTIDFTSPQFYRTTVTPVITSSLKPEELEVDSGEDDVALINQLSGQFGEVISTGSKGVITQKVDSYSGVSSTTTVSSLHEGEAIVGVIKKGKIGVDGRRKKAKVVVVSRLSDFNPILVGKLGAQCSCQSESDPVNLRRGPVRRVKTKVFVPKTTVVPSYTTSSSDVYSSSSTTLSPIEEYSSGYGEQIVEIKPIRKSQRVYSTTSTPSVEVEDDSTYSRRRFGGGRGREDRSQVATSVSANSIAGEGKAGASFDRYGPGGLRGADEFLQGSVDCQRAGLFRHPKYCNKFYSCNWDSWKKRFTLHVFNCPVHLAYDSNLGACNWPSKGPACADDNLLV